MKRILICFAVFSMLSTKVFAAEKSCAVCTELARKGFPEDYREPLCALQLSHPEWDFEPLFVTELSREQGEEYTFSFVLTKESAHGRSLVTGGEEFEPYRDGEAVFDTGLFDATRDTVAYFLDPRNFLSEKGVFQFLRITTDAFSTDGIRNMLEGSAAGTVDGIEELLVSIGEETGLDPLFLASRLRQEQGSNGSPLFWGTAGSTLSRWYREGTVSEDGKWVAAPDGGSDEAYLKSLDGVYNPFHASASGEGAFAVYLAGAEHGRKMGWDSLEKGLLGGAEKICDEYARRFQDTPYLQKWNVDIRSVTPEGGSRNFWGQYMQNVGGAKTEGDRLYESYKSAGLLDGARSFSIPVYEEMGGKNADPAGGACPVFAAEAAPSSEHLYLQEVVAPASSRVGNDTTENKQEEKEESPFWAFVPVAAVVLLGWGIGRCCCGKKCKKLRHFHQKK